MFAKGTDKFLNLSEDEQGNHEKKLLDFFTNAFLKTEIAKKIPTLHIHASCHAAVR